MIFPAVIILFFSAIIIFSIILNLRDYHWYADIETAEGRVKFKRLGYEHLELERRRLRQLRQRTKSYYSDADYIIIPLDAPVPVPRAQESSRSLWKPEPDRFDQLRVLGKKDGKIHVVYRTYFSPDTYRKVSGIVEELEKSISKSADNLNP